MKSTKFLWSGVLVLVVLLFASYLIPNFYLNSYGVSRGVNSEYGSSGGNSNNYNGGWGNGANGYGMMDAYRGMMRGYGGMMGGNFGYSSNRLSKEELSEDKVNKEMEDSLKNATVDKENNSITYTGNNIKIVLLGAPKQADEKFIIGGLINPTVYIPKNSNVTLELINEDKGMPHALEITNAAPPYAYMTMMQGEIYPGSFIEAIPPAVNGQFYADSTIFTANYEGEFYYICQYPGHASEGMYGKIVVK